MRFRFLAPSILVSCASLALDLSAACQSTPETVHVAVRVFDLNNEPVHRLLSANFLLASPAGTPVPATLESPDTHLLLILSPGQGDLTPSGSVALAQQLAPLWKRGWHVSIHDSQGRQTGYLADEAALRAALRAGALVHASVPDSIGTLAEFPGLRILFIQTGPHFGVDPATLTLAHRYHAMLYRVGAPRSNRFQPGGCTQDQDLPIFTGDGGAVIGQTSIPGGCFSSTAATPYVHEETSLHSAAHDAQLDASAFYDLRATIPSDTPSLTLAVQASSNVPTTYRVTAQPWAEDREPLPTVTIR